ncbi:MAG: aryl-sulfate sulfotransferase [Thermoanaerobaculia bacterium]
MRSAAALVLSLGLLPVPAAAASYAALQRSTELQYWDASRAQSGYTFFGVGGTTYLLDMEGRVVHTWPIGTNPHLLSDGSVLDASTDDPSGFGSFKQVAWDGTTLWTYKETRSTYHPHHDFTRIWNPKLKAYTTLFIANKDLTYAQLVAAGADPSRTPSTGGQMDAIVEVDATGTVVWEWCFFDHVVQDFDATKPNYVGSGKTIASYPNRLNINLTGHNLKGDWLHCNSLDFNPALDQVVVNSVQGEFYVIDHGNTFVAGNPTSSIALAATSAGDFLYRFGDPARYGQGEKPRILDDWTLSTTGNKQLGGSHDIQWIPEGLPGAGHFLVFDNAEYLSEHTSQSYVMEIDPYLDASGNDTGHYVNPPDAGYVTVTSPAVTDKTPKQVSRQVVWTYASKSSLTLFATIGSSAQRLPNGNTLVCGDNDGYVSEVTSAGAAVWEYIVPITKSGKLLVLGDRIPMTNSIFRAYRYLSTDPALAGRTLTGGTTIAGRTTVENPYAGDAGYKALQRPTETQYWDSTNAYNGYTLFAAQGKTYLVDMQGRVAHSWSGGTDPRLLESGNLLDWATDASGNTGLRERDWNGNTVWSHFETRSGYHPHGDFRRIRDPKLGAYATLYLANRDVTAAECLAAGCDPAGSPWAGAQVDTIVEVDASGTVVWEWSFWDHAVQAVDSSKANYAGAGKSISDFPGRINLNLPGRPLQANWLDCNSLDYNQALDQVVVNSRQGELYVVDHGNTFVAGNPASSIALAATSAGDFLYRFGDPARYGQGNPPSVGTNWETATSGNKQIGGSSNAQWIASGIPGAGHLLVFDNNQYLYQRTPQSYVFEINPYLNSSGTDTGAYVNPPTAGYVTWTFDKDTMKANQLLSKQVVWKHGSLSNLTLFSHFGSSAQRLPNGNTLICATTEGYLVEVDASGNVVWEYINPVTDAGIVTDIGDDLPMTNAVPRALRYAATFAGFTGHDLTATATIAESAAPIASFTFSPSAPKAGETVTFTDTSANEPTSWSWSFGDGGTSSAKSPTHVFATAGAFTVSLTATNAAGPGTASKVVTVSSGGATVSVTRFLPIVLDVTGRARYVSELTLANRGSSSASVTLLYTAASAFGGQGSGSVSLSLAAGRQLVLDDAIGSLRSSGLSIPSGNQGGSLRVTFANVSSADAAYAGVRITAPSENGRAGVAYVGPLLEALPSSTSWLYGLRSSSEDRTNVAFANASTSSSVTLRLTLVNGNGSSEKHVFDDVTLGPGQWAQLDDVFVGTGFSQGYASVSVVSGSGPYFAYAVFNDNGTNDGSFAPFESEPAPSEARLVPVVVETGTYSSELVLANTSSTARTVELSYVESLSPSQGAGGTTTESLAAGEQKILPSILDLLRTKVGSIGPSGGSYAGSLSARFLSGGNLVAGYAGARTGSPARSGTGRYGLFYAGVGTSSRASSAAWVYGLRQDSLVRTNVAVAASPENSSSITVHAEVWNGSTGSLAGTTDSVTLSPGGWKQWANLLPTYGVAQGYVRVVSDSSSGSFTAYAVVNDGPAPGSANGTDDGSFVPAVNVAAP